MKLGGLSELSLIIDMTLLTDEAFAWDQCDGTMTGVSVYEL